MNIIFKSFVNLVIATAIFAFTSHVFATTNVSTSAVSQGVASTQVAQTDTSAHTSTVKVDLNQQFADGSSLTGQAFASGYSDYGVLKVLATADSGNGSNSSGQVTSSFSDILNISSGLPNGTLGTAIIKLNLNYGGALSGSFADSGFRFQLRSSNFLFQVDNSISCNPSCTSSNTAFTFDTSTGTGQDIPIPLNHAYSIAIPFIHGQALALDLSTFAIAHAYNGASSAIMDSSHSFYWGGITQIFDQNSNIVSDFTVTSTSGTNYLQDFSVAAVPEPESYAMFLAGLGLMRLVSRRPKANKSNYSLENYYELTNVK